MEIYKAASGTKEHIETLLDLLSMRDMGKVKSVLQMVLYEDGSVGVDTGMLEMNDMLLFKGHLELCIQHRYLLRNGCPAVDPYAEEEEEEEEEEDEDGE